MTKMAVPKLIEVEKLLKKTKPLVLPGVIV